MYDRPRSLCNDPERYGQSRSAPNQNKTPQNASWLAKSVRNCWKILYFPSKDNNQLNTNLVIVLAAADGFTVSC